MAKGRAGRGRSVRTDASRDQFSGSLTRDALSTLLRPVGPARLDFREIEDLRTWHPDPERGALTIGGQYARVVAHKRPVVARANTLFSPSSYPVGLQVPVGVKFESPFKVITCLRRKVRREIMFAKDKAGFGKKHRRPRRTWRSNVSC